MSNETIVSISELRKQFDSVTALAGVSLDIKSGSIIGLLGANGSGKSTLLRHIVGLYLPSGGECTTFGCDAAKLGPEELGRIGYVHQEGELLDWMTVEQLVRYVSAYYPTWNEELEQKYRREFDLLNDVKVGTMSPGQRQKLAILLAIGFEPELLILDEPAAAMDPLARQKFLNLLLDLIQDPKRTIIISSHILSDVEKVIDHVTVLDAGKILYNNSFDTLREEFTRVKFSSLADQLPSELSFNEVYEEKHGDIQSVITLRGIAPQKLEAIAEEFHCETEFLPITLDDLYRYIIEGPMKK